MATYRMSITDFSTDDLGYIDVTMSPEPGTPIFPGDTVTINGSVLSKRIAVKRLFFNFPDTDPDKDFDADFDLAEFVLLKSFAKNAAGSFSISCTLNERLFSGMTSRFMRFQEFDTFYMTICDQAQDSDTATYLATRGGPEIVYGKYRLSPQILAMDFERAAADGTWADDGQYLQCKALKISLNPQAIVGDVMKATITCTGSDGSSRSVNLTEEQLTAAFTSDGYSETEPRIFADFVSALGVDYTLTLTLGDDYEQATFTDAVMRSFARLHLSGAKGGGVAVGMFSASTDDVPKFEVADTHETHLYGKTYAEGGIMGVTNYEEGEVLTGGHWIDGKPIYRLIKKITVKPPAIGANGSSFTGVKFFTDKVPEHIVFSHVDVLNSSGSQSGGTKLPYQSAWAYSIDYYFTPSAGSFCFVRGARTSQSAATYQLRVMVWYTKSDTPVPSSDPALPEGPEIFDDGPYADEGVARADYIAMMAGIEIPTDAEATGDVQADAGGMEPPGIEGEPQHSAKFDTVKLYYDAGRWNAQMVKAAVGKWIANSEAEGILNNKEGETHDSE